MDLLNRSVPEEIVPTFYSCVGMIIVNWTFVENSLDAWSAIAFHDHGGSGIEAKLPKQFASKTSFLKKCFEHLPTLSPYANEARCFIDKVSDLSTIRHYVAHGTLSHFDPSDASFKFVKIDMTPDKKEHKFGELHILGTDLVKAGEELNDLAEQGQEITRRLLREDEVDLAGAVKK